MPVYRRRRAPMKKKPYRRRAPIRRRRRTTTTKVRSSIIPDRMIVKMPYVDYQTVNSAGGPGGNYFQKTYSLNALYDPEPGAINTFPLGYREYSTLYQRYRVFAASYIISLWNGSDDTAVNGSLYIADAGGTGGLNSNVTSWLTQPRARNFSLGNKSGGKSHITLKGKVYMPGYAGMTPTQYKTSQDTWGLLTGSGTAPVKNMKLFINLANTNIGVTTALVSATIKIIYHCEVYDRAQFTAQLNTTDGDDPDGGEEPTE